MFTFAMFEVGLDLENACHQKGFLKNFRTYINFLVPLFSHSNFYGNYLNSQNYFVPKIYQIFIAIIHHVTPTKKI